MNPDPSDPLLRALLEDDAWRASCREAQAGAHLRLRRRRCWRKLRSSLAVAVIATAIGWFAWHNRPHVVSTSIAATSIPVTEKIRLQLALHLPVATNGPLSVRAYEPLSDWTLETDALAASTQPAPPLLPTTSFQQ